MNSYSPNLIFIHVPKCAGGTLIQIINHMYGKDYVEVYDASHNRSFGYFEEKNVRAICGHFPQGALDHLFPDVPKVTVLRDPVERVISQYFFLRRSSFPVNQEYVQRIREGNCSILEMAQEDGARNVMSHYISDLNGFQLVGIVEEYEAFLSAFFSMFNEGEHVEVVPYNKNIERTTPMYESVSETMKVAIEKLNSEDVALYERAKEFVNE